MAPRGGRSSGWKNGILSDRRTLVLAVEPDPSRAPACLERIAAAAISGATAYIATNGKVDTRPFAKLYNIESDYPAAPAELQTLSAWADTPIKQDECFRDALELHCLERVLSREPNIEFALLLRATWGGQRSYQSLTGECRDRLFVTFDKSTDSAARGNLLLYTGAPQFSDVLDLARELFESGAAYGISPYSLDEVLADAAGAASIRAVPAGER